MRLCKANMVIISGAIGAAIGGALFAAGSNAQAVGWHPGFPIAGALSGAAVGMGMACRQVRVTTAAALVGASIPSAMEELSVDDGGFIVIPLFGAFVGWTVAALGRWAITRRCSLNTSATGLRAPIGGKGESPLDSSLGDQDHLKH
jgi:hypothetical protein